MKLRPLLTPHLAIAVTVFCWASAFPAIRAGLAAFGPAELAALRLTVSSVVLAILALFIRPRRPTLADMPLIATAGLIGLSLYSVALNAGELTVTAGIASFIINTAPVFAVLLATAFLRERLNRWGWIGIGTGFAGVTLMALSENSAIGLSRGATLVLVAAVLQASYFVMQRPLLRRYDALTLASWMIWAGTLFILPFLPSAIRTAGNADPQSLIAAIYLGVLPGALGYFTWTVALSHFPTSQATGYLFTIPPLATLLGYLWLGEIPSGASLSGGAIALAGVAILARRGRAVLLPAERPAS